MKYLLMTDLRIRYFFVAIIICFAMTLSSCKQKPEFNVLFVTFDTTRADHIGAYGKFGASTPNLDELAKDGVVYENALTSIPITLPSHSSMMTGKVPFTHGVRDNGLFNLNPNQNTLAETLKSNGYSTGAAIGSFPLTSQFGINQGFDYYNEHIEQKFEDIFGERTIPKTALFFDERKAVQVNDAILPWIKEHFNKPFFAWVHYFDPHHPHEPPSPYNQSFAHDLYQGEIAYSDENFGEIINQLKSLGIYDNTLIVFTSDHGEGNFEHNESTHSLLIYNSTLHVPLIVKYPNNQYANTRIKNWVGLVDLFPTVLDMLDIETPDDIQGKILPVEHNNATHEIYAETLSPRFSRGWGEQRGLIKDGYKYIYGPLKELYNLEQDPGEVDNLINDKPELANSMEYALQEYIDENQVEIDLNNSVNIDSDTLNILRGLGYIQSSGKAVEKFEEKLTDEGDAPQLHIDTISTYSSAKQEMFNGNYIEAIRYLDALLLTDSNNLAYLELQIQAQISIGNLDYAKQLLENLPNESFGTITSEKRLQMLAKIHFNQNNLTKSEELLLKSEKNEKSLNGQFQLAQIYKIKNDFVKQQFHLVNLLELDGSIIEAKIELAISYALSGDLYAAEQTFIQAIQSNPYNQKSYYNYGIFLDSINDSNSAITQFNRALELDSRYVVAQFSLVLALTKLNKLESAKIELSKLEVIAPDSKEYKIAKQFISEQK